MCGFKDDELIVRWIQFGVFSPIMRLHSTDNDFMSKEPWNYNKIAESAIIDFLRLRHKLIPYLYSMNYRAYNDDIPLITPVYYLNKCSKAYEHNKNEYYFGSEMIVSPITSKSDSVTQMGCANTYIPEGIWFDFFNGRKYRGNQCCKLYRGIYTIPVLVKAGGIIPMSDNINNTENPKNITVQIFPGANNSFTLYEDDGTTMNYENGEYAKTVLELQWRDAPKFIIHKPEGSRNIITGNRSYTLVFKNISVCGSITVTENNNEISFDTYSKNNDIYVCLDSINGETVIGFESGVNILENDHKKDIFDLLLYAQSDNNEKEQIYNLLQTSHNAVEFINGVNAMEINRNLYDAIIEIVSFDSGF